MAKCLYSDATVKELAKAYDVSRAVIRDVLSLLENTAEQRDMRQADAVSDLIGTNVQIAYTDSNGPNFSGRWALPSIHFWGTGNVWRTKGEHHKAHRPVGHYIASQDHAMVTFTLFANIYSTSPTPLYATINDCGMTVERYTPDA